MKLPGQNLKFLFIKMFILSFFIHFLLLEIFVFKIPVKNSPFKPTFTYYGAILSNQEISGKQSGIRQLKLTDPLDHISRVSTDGKDRVNYFSFDKPASLTPKSRSKETAKTTFLDSDKLRSNGKMEQDLGITIEPSSYQPLELDSK